jgi:hypothetical protein
VPGRAAGGGAAEPKTEPDSHFVALTVLGSAVRIERNWDSGFGGELLVGGLTDRTALAAWAAGFDLIAYSERGGGRASLEGAVGTRWPTGLLIGVAAGPVAELDDFRRPRLGGQISLWAFAAVVPFVRLGTVEKSGSFVDVGVRIPLPVWRW